MRRLSIFLGVFVALCCFAATANATALSAARLTQSKNLGAMKRYLMKASTTIYAGGLVMIDSNGLAVPAAASASNHGVVGVATSTVTSAASGSYYVVVQEGWFLFAGDTLQQDDVGKIVFADDDATVDETRLTNSPVAGVLVEYVSASSGWVAVTPLLVDREPLTLREDITLQYGAVLGQSADNKVDVTENSEDIVVEFKSNELELSSSTGVVQLDLGAVGTTLTLANGQTVGSGTDNKLTLGDNSEDFTLEFKANELECSSSTGVVELDLGAVGTTVTLANGQTIGSGTDNKLTLGDNSEDVTVEFKANEVELSSSTGVVSFDFADVLPVSSATGALGWALVAGADTACNTTCTHACVFGFDDGTTTIVACDSALADKCICAGAN